MDFLKNTLEIDQQRRLTWEQTLAHDLFTKKEESLPEFFIPNLAHEFEDLRMVKDIDTVLES
jgi:hypothetical protein